MDEIIKTELTTYAKLLQENGIAIENLKGRKLRIAIKTINKYKKQFQSEIEKDLDRQLMLNLRNFL